MAKLRSKIFRINKVQPPIQEKRPLIKSKEKLVPDPNAQTIENPSFDQNDITDPSMMVNSKIVNLDNRGFEKVDNSDLRNSNNTNKPMLIENYAHVLIRDLRLINNNKNNGKLSHYQSDGL